MEHSILFLNGEIVTANLRDEVFRALLIAEGRIVFVGDEEDALSLADRDTEIIDLQNKAIIPGFINTAPISFPLEPGRIEMLERHAVCLRAEGWTSLRLCHGTLARLRALVAGGELSVSRAPHLFRLYERAELLAEHTRFTALPYEELESESLYRRAEWMLRDGNALACTVGEYETETSALSFFASLPRRGVGAPRHRLYLHRPMERRRIPPLRTLGILPVLLDSAVASLPDFLECGLPAVLADSEGAAGLAVLSGAGVASDDYRTVPRLLSALTVFPASLEALSQELGSLEWGKRADFLILSAPLLGCPPSRLSELGILETYVDGRKTVPITESLSSSRNLTLVN